VQNFKYIDIWPHSSFRLAGT